MTLSSSPYIRHRSIFTAFFFLFISSFCIVAQASDGPGPSPDKTLSSLLQQLKSSKDPLVILEYVHWPTAFNNMPKNEREAIRVNSGEELKAHFQKLFQNPDGFLNDRLAAKYPDMTEEKRKALQDTSARMVMAMKEQRQKMQERLANTDYKIGKVETNGNDAVVELLSTLDGQTKVSKVKLEKVSGSWYLPSVRFVQEQKGADRK